MTPLEMRDVNAKIARQERVDKMVVAGIASNMTRGTYGSLRSLIAKRRRQLNQAQAAG